MTHHFELAPKALWERRLLSRDDVEEIITNSRMPEWCDTWASNREAALLLLGSILDSAIERQMLVFDEPRQVTTEEYRQIRRVARKLRECVELLQDTDDPPDLLPLAENGKSVWENWSAAAGLGRGRGRPSKCDQECLFSLMAFHQLAQGRISPGFSYGNGPLIRLLQAAFGAAAAALSRITADTRHSGRPHTLISPPEDTLAKQYANLPRRTKAVLNLQTKFDRIRKKLDQKNHS